MDYYCWRASCIVYMQSLLSDIKSLSVENPSVVESLSRCLLEWLNLDVLDPADVCFMCRKCFPIPEVIFDPDLLLSPHIFLLTILFQHRAFKSEILNDNPRLLYTSKIEAGENQIKVGLRPDIMNTHVFRRTEKTVTGLQMGTRPIDRSMMSKMVGTVGRLAGFEGNTICYTLRYMAGNNLDQSGMYLCSLFLLCACLQHAWEISCL